MLIFFQYMKKYKVSAFKILYEMKKKLLKENDICKILSTHNH